MSARSSGEDLSINDEEGYESEDSPRFGDSYNESQDNENEYDQDRQDFDSDNSNDSKRGTFELENQNPFQTNKESYDSKSKTFFGNLNKKDDIYSHSRPPVRPNVNDSKNADNEELKFILSHSNTFLTNEQVEEKQKYFSKTQNDQKQDQIIDIDGCSEASYSELKESVK